MCGFWFGFSPRPHYYIRQPCCYAHIFSNLLLQNMVHVTYFVVSFLRLPHPEALWILHQL